MSKEKIGAAATAGRALEATETNPLDFVPDKIPFDTPYGLPISLERAGCHTYRRGRSEEPKLEDERSGRRFGRQPRRLQTNGRCDTRLDSDRAAQGACSRDLPARNEEYSRTVPHSPQQSADVRRNDCLTRRHPTIEQGVIIGAIGCSGGTDSQDEIVSETGAAVINLLPPRNG